MANPFADTHLPAPSPVRPQRGCPVHCWTSAPGAYYRRSYQFSLVTSTRAHSIQAGSYRLLSSSWRRTSVLIGSAAVRCRSSDETPWSPPFIDFQSSRRPAVAMCYCRRSVVCYCRPLTLEQSTCWRPVCLVTHNISSKAGNSFISTILPRHCFITASP